MKSSIYENPLYIAEINAALTNNDILPEEAPDFLEYLLADDQPSPETVVYPVTKIMYIPFGSDPLPAKPKPSANVPPGIMSDLPIPGSLEALGKGCKCPAYENDGYAFISNGKGYYFYTVTCPMHRPLIEPLLKLGVMIEQTAFLLNGAIVNVALFPMEAEDA